MSLTPQVTALACAALAVACSSDAPSPSKASPDAASPLTDAAAPPDEDGSSAASGGAHSGSGGAGSLTDSGAGGDESGGAPTTDGAAGSLAVESGTPEDAGLAARCARGPFITETVTVSELSNPHPVPDVTVLVEPCGVRVQTAATGKASFQYPASLPHRYRLSATGFITTHLQERFPTSDDTATSLVIVGDTGQKAWMPDYVVGQTEIMVAMGVFPPATNDGVTITVPGLPTATITQWIGQVKQPDGPTALHGHTTITNLPDSGFVTLAGSKPGHTVVFDNVTSGPQAEFEVEKGAVTYVDAYVAD